MIIPGQLAVHQRRIIGSLRSTPDTPIDLPEFMHFLVRLAREALRRNLLGTLGILVGGGWVVLQVMDMFIERGLLPEWTFNGALAALALGLPMVLATAFVQAGRRLAIEESDESEVAVESDLTRLFTWNRVVLGGFAAFALLGAGTAGYMVMRVTGIGAPGTLEAQGTFDIGSRVVIADFESSVGDAAPSDLVTEALRIDLSQTEAFDLVDPSRVASVLGLMLVSPEEPLSEEVAREVAVRLGAAGVISGEVGRVGSTYVLTSRLIEAESGAVLAPFRQTARDSTELLDMIDALAGDMRAKVGESLRAVASSESLARATTNSLEALKKYSYVQSRLPRRAIEPGLAQRLLQEAVALDSTFASANISLAIQIRNWGGSSERAWYAAAQAYRHRDRLTEGERYFIEAYYLNVSGDLQGAATAYRQIMDLNPESRSSAVNLADISMYRGDYATAISVLRDREARDTWVWSWNLITALAGAGQIDEALAEVDSLVQNLPEDESHLWVRGLLLMASGDIQGARAWNESAAAAATEDGWRFTAMSADLDLLAGNVAAAREKFRGLETTMQRLDLPASQLYFAHRSALATAWVEGDGDRAAGTYAATLQDVDVTDLSVRDQDLPRTAVVFAVAGDEERVASTLKAYRAGVDVQTDAAGRTWATAAERLIAVQPGDDDSLAALGRALDDLRCARCADLLRGVEAETAGDVDAAIASYERYLAHRFFDAGQPLMFSFTTNVHERLGPLYEEAGNPEKAVEHYLRFAELWENADAPFRPRVDFARSRAEALAANE